MFLKCEAPLRNVRRHSDVRYFSISLNPFAPRGLSETVMSCWLTALLKALLIPVLNKSIFRERQRVKGNPSGVA